MKRVKCIVGRVQFYSDCCRLFHLRHIMYSRGMKEHPLPCTIFETLRHLTGAGNELINVNQNYLLQNSMYKALGSSTENYTCHEAVDQLHLRNFKSSDYIIIDSSLNNTRTAFFKYFSFVYILLHLHGVYSEKYRWRKVS